MYKLKREFPFVNTGQCLSKLKREFPFHVTLRHKTLSKFELLSKNISKLVKYLSTSLIYKLLL